MHPLLVMLRDIFFRSVSALAEQKLQEYIEKHCCGCSNRRIRLKKDPTTHNICIMMTWDAQVIIFLPDILKKFTVKMVRPTFTKTFNRIRPKFADNEMKDVPMPFNLDSFIYTSLEELHTNVAYQTSIAQAVYSQFCANKADKMEKIDVFGKRYMKGLTKY